jgi:hypothetical protein
VHRLALAFLAAHAVWAADAAPTTSFEDAEVKFHLDCRLGSSQTALDFTIAKANLPNWDGGESEDLWLGKPPKLIGPELDAAPIPAHGEKSACGKWLGYPTGNDRLLVPFLEDDRPLSPQVGAVVVDTQAKLLLGLPRKLGAVVNTNVPHPKPIFVAAPGGFRFLSWNPRTDAGGGNATIHGQEVSVDEDDLFYWVRVSFEGNRIEQRIDREATWHTTKFKPYFHSQAEFESAFGLNSEGTRFKNRDTVMTAHLYGKKETTCIQPTSDRNIRQGDQFWFCR